MPTVWRWLVPFRVWPVIVVVVLSLGGSPVYAGEVLVAVAANFLKPMKEIAKSFETGTGHRVLLSPGSTGRLYAQIINGAPFEVFLSADAERPRLLVEQRLAVDGSQLTYAVGRLVLWSWDSKLIQEGSPHVLRDGAYSFLAIANPKTAPYGRAAVQTLKHLAVWDRVASRLIQGENIAQTLQFVASGNAELGFVATSQVLDPRLKGTGSQWMVPETYHDPLRQDLVLLTQGQGNPVATALIEFFGQAHARTVVARYGYGFPKAEGK